MENQREKFLARLQEMISKKSANSMIFTEEKYKLLVKQLQRIEESGPRSSTNDYRKRALYELQYSSGNVKIVKKDTQRILVHAGEFFDLINISHAATQHGGRDVLQQDLRTKYENIPRDAIMAFLELCENCHMKRKKLKKGLVANPTISDSMNSRCQVDLIDWQNSPDGEYKYIFVYQDHLTKFVQLRPQKTETVDETAHNVLDVMCIFGAPLILQSDIGRQFSKKVITKMMSLWPECHIVHGMPRHSQSQGAVERCKEDIQVKLKSWMRDNCTSHWVEGLRFVQLKMNRRLNEGIGQSPYKALFGTNLKVGMWDSILPVEVFQGITTEEEFEEKLQENMRTKDNTEGGSVSVKIEDF